MTDTTQTIADSTPITVPVVRASGFGVMSVALIAMLSSVVSIAAYHYAVTPSQTRLAVVDLPAVFRDKEAAFTAALTRDGATEQERQDALDTAKDFARRLPKALDELADDCACVVLTSNAVAGRHRVPDMTPALRAKVGL